MVNTLQPLLKSSVSHYKAVLENTPKLRSVSRVLLLLMPYRLDLLCLNLSNPNKMCREIQIMVQLISSLLFFPDIYDDLVADYFITENQVRSIFILIIPSYGDKTDRQERIKGASPQYI